MCRIRTAPPESCAKPAMTFTCRRLLDHPFDDFLEAVIDGGDSKKSIRAAMDQGQGIVGRYGGGDIHDGEIGSDYVPFAEAFADAAK
jgi:hypothetical protein